MVSGKPILAMINGEARSILAESRCGLSCAAGDYEGFVDRLIEFSQMSFDERVTMGENGKSYFENHFTKDKCLSCLEELIVNNI